MARRYRLLDTTDWETLDGARVRVEVSASNIWLELKDGSVLKIAVVKRDRPTKATTNGRAPEQDGLEPPVDATRPTDDEGVEMEPLRER